MMVMQPTETDVTALVRMKLQLVDEQTDVHMLREIQHLLHTHYVVLVLQHQTQVSQMLDNQSTGLV